MKKIWIYFMLVMLMLMVCVTLALSGAIYNSGENVQVDTYFFQANHLSSERPGQPLTPAQLGATRVQEIMVGKFLHEYFYVIPDVENINNRINDASPLRYMFSKKRNDFKNWRNTVAQDIQELAAAKALRTVKLVDMYRPSNDSDFWVVTYELKTWKKPNDLNLEPEITRGTMHISVWYRENCLRPDTILTQTPTLDEVLKKYGPEGLLCFGIKKLEMGQNQK